MRGEEEKKKNSTQTELLTEEQFENRGKKTPQHKST